MVEKILRKTIKMAAGRYYNFIYNNKKELKYIPSAGKVLGKEELNNMIDASLDMWLTSGRFNSMFEKQFALYLGVKYCFTCNSGSSANLLALSSLTSYTLGEKQVQKGDEVITVASGFPTTINPIIQLGLIPVFIDCDIETCNIDVKQVEESITDKTKVILIAHTLGNVFDLEVIKEICKRHNLWLIEDNCDALGAKYDGKYTGTIGDIGTFSFYPAHHITMGEGGAVVTNNPQLSKLVRSFRDWGRDCWCDPGKDNNCGRRFSQKLGNLPFGYDHKFTYSHIGYNLKITDWQAAIGVAQLKKVDNFIKKRRANFKYLYNKLGDLQNYIILPKIIKKSEPSWFGFLISMKPNDKFSKQQLVEHLEKDMIGTRQLFAGNILRQPIFVDNDINLRIKNSEIKKSNALTEEDYKLLPNADFIMNNSFWVGIYPAINSKHLDKISESIHEFIKGKI
jgi:CDP-6-deoxy-D-xylo-4-hexulose-3-dehydrase